MTVSRRLDLLRWPWVRRLLKARWPQLVVRGGLLAGFLLAILAGWLGTPVGNRNFAIVAVWIAWWAVLILVAVPFLGRAWCSVCPIPLPGEWAQQGGLLAPTGGPGWGVQRPWPRRLRSIWLQNLGFTILALFSAVILTRPSVTAAVLAGMLLLAFLLSLRYERRAFCRYLCPVGGFIGLYAQAAPLELRVKDPALCASHTEKACYWGNGEGYGCPWGVFPVGMVRNNVCGLCFECLRTCEYENLALNLRPFGSDLAQRRGAKLDEAFKAFIMLGSALVYAAVFLGPWAGLKEAAYRLGSPAWGVYALVLLGLTWGLLPGVFALLMAATRPQRVAVRRAVAAQAYALVPVGLAAWAAFSLGFIGASAGYLPPAFGDPFGWGWNLLGLAERSWHLAFAGEVLPAAQALLLGLGLWGSVRAARAIAHSHAMPRTAWPAALYAALFAGGMLWLLLG